MIGPSNEIDLSQIFFIGTYFDQGEIGLCFYEELSHKHNNVPPLSIINLNYNKS
jgi:hypothetical protein